MDRTHLWDLGAILVRNAARFPTKLAYVSSEGALTWSELDVATRRIANGLLEHGLAPGDHVAMLGANHLMWPVVQFAVWRLGAVPVFLHGMLPDRLLLGQLEQADVRALLLGPDFTDRASVLRAASTVDLVFSWGSRSSPGVTSLERLSEEGSDTELPLARSPGDIGLLSYSSGTTGDPKGTVHRLDTLLAKATCMAVTEELRPTDVGLICGPLYMGGSQLMSLIPYAYVGVTCVLMPAFDARAVLESIEMHGVTTLFAVPTMLRELVLAADDSTSIPTLDRVFSSGAPLTQDVYAAWRERFGVALNEVCGSSETGGGLAITQRERDEGKPDSVGRPMLGFLVGVHDGEGREVAVGQRGLLAYRGDAIADGYYNQPTAEREAFRNGWFYTGDVGYRDEDGFYYIVDRAKDMIVTGGVNVFPREVEEVLTCHQDVSECAVIGLPHEKWGEAVHAIIVPRPGSSVTEAELIAHCRERLGSFQVPKSVEFVPEIPRTPVGKVSKSQLRAAR